jgi:hypothetical protein
MATTTDVNKSVTRLGRKKAGRSRTIGRGFSTLDAQRETTMVTLTGVCTPPNINAKQLA